MIDISETGFVFEHDLDNPGVFIYGHDFLVGDGLELIDGRLYGRGELSGMWGDGSSFSIQIIPEPATLLLLGLGGIALRQKIRR